MSIPCIVLAGGLGTRLRGAVPNLPKCLAPIAMRPFLEWQLRSLAERGVSHFLLALGHGADLVLESLMQPWARGLSVDTVVEREPLGTGGAARFVMNEAELDEALIVNGDTFLGGSLQAMLEPLDLSGGEFMRIATIQVPDRTRFGGLSVGKKQCVTAFFEKGHSGPGPINAGFYRINRLSFEAIEENKFSLETLLMPRLVAQGTLQARALSGPFIDIGVPSDYHHFDAHAHEYIR